MIRIRAEAKNFFRSIVRGLTSRILSMVNVPIIRRRDATPQDGLCKTPLVMLAPESVGTWFQRSRHFPLILSIVPAVRNSGFWERSRVLFPRRRPRLRAHNRANFSSHGSKSKGRTGGEKSEGNATNTLDNFLALPQARERISKVRGIEAIRHGAAVKERSKGSYALRT